MMTRRVVNWLTMAAGVGAVLQACGASGETPSSTGTAVLPLTAVGPEVPVGATTPVPALYAQESLAVAPVSTGYLLAWSDARKAYEMENTFRIFVGRADATGKPLPGGRPLAVATGKAFGPSLAATSKSALVAYYTNGGVFAQRLGLDGAPVDGVELALSKGAGARLATDGSSGFLAVWSVGNLVEATTVSASGSVGTTLSLGTRDPNSPPSVTWDGSQYVVSWIQGYAVKAARVSASGVLTDVTAKTVVPATDYLECPDVASTGDGSLLFVWHRMVTGSFMRVEGQRAAKDLSPQGGVFTISRAVAGNATCPTVGWDGSVYSTVWNQYDGTTLDTRAARVGPVGPIDAADLVLANPPGGTGVFRARAHAIACQAGSSACLVGWRDDRAAASKHDLFGGLLSVGKLAPPGGTALATVAIPQRSPVIARGASTTLVAWEDMRAGDAAPYFDDAWDVYGSVLGADGNALGADLPLGVAQLAQVHAAAAFDGSGYVVLWADSRNASSNSSDIYLARVSETGQAMGSAPLLQTSAREAAPAIASSTSGSLVAWIEGDYATGRIMAATLAKGASTLGAPVVLAPNGAGVQVRIATDGAGYLVVWDSYPVGTSTRYVLGARLDAAGKLLDATPISIAAGNNINRPSVAFGAGKYLVGWSTGTSLLAARVAVGGEVGDDPGLLVPTAGGGIDSTEPIDLVFDGSTFFVAWHERASVGTSGDSLQMNLVSAALDPSTGKFSQRVEIESTKTESRGVRLARDKSGVVAVYDRETLGAPLGDRRAFMVRIGEPVGGAAGAGGAAAGGQAGGAGTQGVGGAGGAGAGTQGVGGAGGAGAAPAGSAGAAAAGGASAGGGGGSAPLAGAAGAGSTGGARGEAGRAGATAGAGAPAASGDTNVEVNRGGCACEVRPSRGSWWGALAIGVLALWAGRRRW